ncbi:MAG: hypothetical protein AB4368_02155 [Xenococcaceae cyanobacterium]
MKILHLDLKPIGNDYAEFRYFWDNSKDYQPHKRSLAEVEEQIRLAERDYYTRLPEDYVKTGQALYNWLDGSDRILANALQEPHSEGLVIAIATDKGLAHLPWELLTSSGQFIIHTYTKL